VEPRDAGLRLPPVARPLPPHRHPGFHPQPGHAGHHHQHAEAATRSPDLVHPDTLHLRLLPLQLHLPSHPLVHPGRPLAFRLQHPDPLSVREGRTKLSGHHELLLHRRHRLRQVQVHHAAGQVSDDCQTGF